MQSSFRWSVLPISPHNCRPKLPMEKQDCRTAFMFFKYWKYGELYDGVCSVKLAVNNQTIRNWSLDWEFYLAPWCLNWSFRKCLSYVTLISLLEFDGCRIICPIRILKRHFFSAVIKLSVGISISARFYTSIRSYSYVLHILYWWEIFIMTSTSNLLLYY